MASKRIVIITGSELRHQYMRMKLALSDHIDVSLSICEGQEKSLTNRIDLSKDEDGVMRRHSEARERSEREFFADFCERNSDLSKPVLIPKGDINNPEVIERAVKVGADLIVCYGTSIIKKPWFDAFPQKILNLHLGLSPYYRGSGTNFWAQAHGRFECVGATFMIMDEGIDTGGILHQVRARVAQDDTSHAIGNRLIIDAAEAYSKVISGYDGKLPEEPLQFKSVEGVLCKRADFTAEATKDFYRNFEHLKKDYLKVRALREKETPILINPAMV